LRELTRVVGTINSAVLGASGSIRAGSGVPLVAVVAVGVSSGDVNPAPVGVEHDGAGLGGAASATSARASLPGELGVSLGGHRASLLSAGGSIEREGSESERPVHGCCVVERKRC
jgi:hypothetical protein